MLEDLNPPRTVNWSWKQTAVERSFLRKEREKSQINDSIKKILCHTWSPSKGGLIEGVSQIPKSVVIKYVWFICVRHWSSEGELNSIRVVHRPFVQCFREADLWNSCSTQWWKGWQLQKENGESLDKWLWEGGQRYTRTSLTLLTVCVPKICVCVKLCGNSLPQ